MIIDQIPRYFKNPRSCDIIISTLGEYCFNYEHGKTKGSSPYSHDNALQNSMIVPFIIGGSPEIPQKELSYCKTTDMVPSLLNLLGITPDKSVVGKSIIK
jgi:arylsulfatase A-like enzyme